MASSSGSGYNSDSTCADIDEAGLELLKHINAIKYAGTFATFGELVEIVNPGVEINGVGPVSLPLSHADAQKIVRASRKAPFGRNNETVIDEAVRKTWEIDGSQLQFKHAAFSNWLQSILDRVKVELGLANDFHAELYKMLLYEKGAMFKAHQDTEKVKGMFGTLVICLPSQHTGGAVRARHGMDEEKLFSTASNSAYGVSYLAWYSDVAHEIEPVESGFRWVLTYNLVSDATAGREQALSAAKLSAETSRFEEALNKWHLEGDCCIFPFALQHQYTDSSLKLANLKGVDYERALVILKACSRQGKVTMFLTNLQRRVDITADEEEIETESLNVDDILDISGLKMNAYGLSLSLESLLQPLYRNREADEQWGGEYYGNSNAEISRLYKNTALILVHSSNVPEFLLGSGHTPEKLKLFLNNLKALQKSSDKKLLSVIEQTCRFEISRQLDARNKAPFLEQILLIASSVGNTELVLEALQNVRSELSPSVFFELGCIQSIISTCIRSAEFERILLMPKGLCALWHQISGFNNGVVLSPAAEDVKNEVANKWTVEVLTKAFNKAVLKSPEDAGAFLEIAATNPQSQVQNALWGCLKRFTEEANSALKIPDSHSLHATFINAAAAECLSAFHPSLHDQSSDLSEKQLTCKEALKDIASRTLTILLNLIIQFFRPSLFFPKRGDNRFQAFKNVLPAAKGEKFHLFLFSELLKHIKSSGGPSDKVSLLPNSGLSQAESGKQVGSSGKALTLLEPSVSQAKSVKTDEQSEKVSLLLKSIVSLVESTEPAQLEETIVPLLEAALSTLNPVEKSRFCSSYMVAYSKKVAKMEPAEPKNWTRKWNKYSSTPCRSDCPTCNKAVLFQKDPDKRCMEFSRDERDHLNWRLCSDDNEWTRKDSQTYELTKTDKTWQSEHRYWERRVGNVQQTFENLPSDQLRDSLAEEYDTIMNLSVVRLQPVNTSVEESPSDERPRKKYRVA